MDIRRHLDQATRKPWYKKKWVIPAALVAVLGSLAAWTSTFESALPQAKSESLYIDTVKRGELVVEPRLPSDWKGYHLTYRHAGQAWVIAIARGERRTVVNGQDLPEHRIALNTQGGPHKVEVWRM